MSLGIALEVRRILRSEKILNAMCTRSRSAKSSGDRPKTIRIRNIGRVGSRVVQRTYISDEGGGDTCYLETWKYPNTRSQLTDI